METFLYYVCSDFWLTLHKAFVGFCVKIEGERGQKSIFVLRNKRTFLFITRNGKLRSVPIVYSGNALTFSRPCFLFHNKKSKIMIMYILTNLVSFKRPSALKISSLLIKFIVWRTEKYSPDYKLFSLPEDHVFSGSGNLAMIVWQNIIYKFDIWKEKIKEAVTGWLASVFSPITGYKSIRGYI